MMPHKDGHDRRMRNMQIVLLCMVVFVIVAVPVLKVVGAMQESATYNKLTGAKTTWWDALWVELRVQGEPGKDAPRE